MCLAPMKKLSAFLFLTSLLLLANAFKPATQKVSVEITGLENTKGNIRLGVFTNQENFEKDKSLKLLTFTKKNVKNGILNVEIDLPAGTYGFALLDDENANEKMDFGWVLPDEGFGFSNYYHTSMTRPKFDQFKFTVSNAPVSVKVKMRYM